MDWCTWKPATQIVAWRNGTFKVFFNDGIMRLMKARPTILLVESDAAEEMRARDSITKSEIGLDVRVARDGKEACHALFESDDPVPALILLELNLPKVSGLGVLSRIRGSDNTKRVPVIIFTSSGQRSDVEKSLDLHANSYVRKDLDPELYDTRLKLVLYYWTAVNLNGNA